ncbi:hypothetical protein C8J57DRAFT_1083760 [Mycena rebaudengoi]|nr:hypothetical protein C8J57DRAFT_1083760 [Mycena rebaudengoi]
MRHYLSMVRTQSHRESLTSNLLSTHQLALEVLRYADHARRRIPCNERFCRICHGAVESPEHALSECQESLAVLNLRNTFMEKLFSTVPKMQTKMVELDSC